MLGDDGKEFLRKRLKDCPSIPAEELEEIYNLVEDLIELIISNMIERRLQDEAIPLGQLPTGSEEPVDSKEP